MRMYQLFAHIKKSTPEMEGCTTYMLNFRKELYTLLRYIIQHRREIPLENDHVDTMYEKSIEIIQFLHDNYPDKRDDKYEHNFLYLLAMASDALGKDTMRSSDATLISNDEEPQETEGMSTQSAEEPTERPRFGWIKKATLWMLKTTAFMAVNVWAIHHYMEQQKGYQFMSNTSPVSDLM